MDASCPFATVPPPTIYNALSFPTNNGRRQWSARGITLANNPLTLALITLAPITLAPITLAPITLALITLAPITLALITLALIT